MDLSAPLSAQSGGLAAGVGGDSAGGGQVTPDGWEVAFLDDCVLPNAPICYGILMPGPHCAGGVPVVKVRDIFDGRIDESDLLFTHPSIDGAYKRSRLAAGDLLITIRGTTGRIALTPPALAGANITQDTARIRVKGGTSSEFVYFALQSEQAQQQIALHTIGQAVKGINIRDVRRLTLPIPEKEDEQHAIARALSDVDALLAGLDRLVAKKRDLKQAAMQQLLTGQMRLPGFREAWADRILGECLYGAPDYGINAAAAEWSDRLPTYLRITDISEDGRFRPAPRVAVRSAIATRYLLGEGDIVFARTGASVGKSYRYRAEDGPLVFAGFLIRVRPRPDLLHAAYLAEWVTTKPYWDWVAQMSMRSGQPGISGAQYARMPIRIPSLNEQAAIVDVLSDMDGERAALEVQRQKTQALKQAMMQELLTGRIRLI